MWVAGYELVLVEEIDVGELSWRQKVIFLCLSDMLVVVGGERCGRQVELSPGLFVKLDVLADRLGDILRLRCS